MGYTHNWNVTMPERDPRGLIGSFGLDLLGRARGRFRCHVVDQERGSVLLRHSSGQADEVLLSPDHVNYDGMCKTGRGVAEAHVVELLWRWLFAVNSAGGSMRITSDWACSPTERGSTSLTHDAALAMATLLHGCKDLIAGHSVSAMRIPRAWPPRPCDEFYSEAGCVRHMLHCAADPDLVADALVFGIRDNGLPEYTETHTPESPRFAELVNAHVDVGRDRHLQVLRGFCFADCAVWLDGQMIVGTPSSLRLADHPQSLLRQLDLLPLVPEQAWLAEEIATRSAGACA